MIKKCIIQSEIRWPSQFPEDEISNQILIQLKEDEDNSFLCEFTINWEYGNMFLRIYNDAWCYMLEYVDLLDMLAQKENQNLTPDEMVNILTNLGYTNNT